jgi:single-stranded DNA-binding protein
MSARLNEFKLLGVFNAPARVKETTTNSLLCKRLLTVYRGWTNPRTGCYEEDFDDFDLCAWGRVAEDMSDIPEGTSVLVIGKLKLEHWGEDNRSSLRLAVDSIQRVCE